MIENLTYKSTDGRVGQANFDPLILEEVFQRTIEDLEKINGKCATKIESLEAECQKEKIGCKDKIVDLEAHYKVSTPRLLSRSKFSTMKKLRDCRHSYVYICINK